MTCSIGKPVKIAKLQFPEFSNAMQLPSYYWWPSTIFESLYFFSVSLQKRVTGAKDIEA